MYTNFLIKMKSDYDENVLLSVIQSSRLENIKFSYKKLCKEDNIYIINFQANKLVNEYTYEENLKKSIQKINDICDYISVLHDSVTQKRMEIISKNIYIIERNFRNLIEIIFLKLEGEQWFKKYYSGQIINRKEERGSIVKYLNNPLDDLDFIKLNDFVKNFLYEKNEALILERLESIEAIVNLMKEKKYTISGEVKEIHKEIESLKNLLMEKRKGKKISEIYDCISVTDTAHWKELYNLRCLWAHNNCYLTFEEFNSFNKTYNEIEYKINNEITHLILDYDKNQIYNGKIINTMFESYKNEGYDKYILKFTDNRNLIQILKNDANYSDLKKMIEIIYEHYFENRERIDSDETSPFFLFEEAESILCKLESEIVELEPESINSIENACIKKEFIFNNLLGCEEQIKDHDIYLKTIFRK